ncbi:MAG: DUF6173 family protein [Candidatus Thiodiazotropha sp.]
MDEIHSSALDTPRYFQEQMEQMRKEREEIYHDRNPVVKACKALHNYVLSFERELDEEHEVGVRLVSFGNEVSFHVQQIGFSKPNIVTFYGVNSEGERLQLIQHVSQLSFLLMAVKKFAEKPCRIGFIWD